MWLSTSVALTAAAHLAKAAKQGELPGRFATAMAARPKLIDITQVPTPAVRGTRTIALTKPSIKSKFGVQIRVGTSVLIDLGRVFGLRNGRRNRRFFDPEPQSPTSQIY